MDIEYFLPRWSPACVQKCINWRLIVHYCIFGRQARWSQQFQLDEELSLSRNGFCAGAGTIPPCIWENVSMSFAENSHATSNSVRAFTLFFHIYLKMSPV